MNKTILMGRLTRDPEIRTAAGGSGTTIARFTLAVNRRFRRDSEESADFISCVAFGKTAEFIEKYITKGRQICVCGRIQTGSYTNQEGRTIYTTEVVVEEADFADSRPNANAPQNPQPAQQAAPSSAQNPAPDAAMPAPEAPGFDGDEDIPFN